MKIEWRNVDEAGGPISGNDSDAHFIAGKYLPSEGRDAAERVVSFNAPEITGFTRIIEITRPAEFAGFYRVEAGYELVVHAERISPTGSQPKEAP